MPSPWASKRTIVTDPSVNPSVRQAIASLAKSQDLAVVWAPPGADLNRVCNVAGTSVVQLYADATYRCNLVTLTRPVEIVGPASAIIAPQYGYTGTQKIVVNCSTGTVILRGPAVQMPIEANTPVTVKDVEIDTSLTTTNGAKIEISGSAASNSYLDGCESADTDGIGILIRDGAEDCVVNGCDFSAHSNAIETWAALNTRGLDTNPGVVVVH